MDGGAAVIEIQRSAGKEDEEGAPDFRRSRTFAEAGGLNITIQDLTYTVQNSANRKESLRLLQDVTGFFRAGEMAALMGPSGSGKTTLLDLLAGRKTVGETAGSILFAGRSPSSSFLRRYTGYVEQFDTLLPELTVEEMLLYTAELKRPRGEPRQDKRAAVEALLDKLALASCRSVKIGDPLSKGISGGQAKRVNIGIALITNPRVLFLDEPTSGLDSFTANEVMGVVQSLTRDGVTIVATIHSPTAAAFSLFDSLMLLVRGRTVYFGRAGDQVLKYIGGLPPSSAGAAAAAAARGDLGAGQLAPPAAQLEAAAAAGGAEWVVELFTRADREGRGGDYAEAYAASALRQGNGEQCARLARVCPDLPSQVQAELQTRRATVTPWWSALWTMAKYRTRRNYCSPSWLGSRIGDKIVMGAIMITLYVGVGADFSPSNLVNQAALLFMWVTMPAFGAAAYVPAIVLERRLYVRERNDGLYTAGTYLAAKMLDELTINFVVSVAMAAAAFYAIKLQGSFLLFWLVYFVTLCMGVVLAYFVASLSPTIDVANASLPLLVSCWLFFGGFLMQLSAIPVWWKWFSYLNPLRYAWTAVMINQYSAKDPRWLGGRTVLQHYGFAGQSEWANLGYVAAFFVAFTVCAWATLKWKRYQLR